MFIYSSKSELSLQAKAMQDSEILNNFKDLGMRQVWSSFLNIFEFFWVVGQL